MHSLGRLEPSPEPDEALKDDFRQAMRQLAGGVSVVTTGAGPLRTGLTATSVSSLSMQPPSLIVCINRTASALEALRRNKTFGVSFLPASRADLADRFAGRGGERGIERFANLDCFALATGAPLLSEALAAVDCTVETVFDWATHAIIVGRVEGARVLDGASPLVYWRGDYLRA